MEPTFNYLRLHEENALSPQEKIDYVNRLRQYVRHRPLTNTTAGAITVAPKLKKLVNRLDAFVTRLLAGGKLEYVVDGIEHIPQAGGVLFASTHQGMLDSLCWIPGNPRHCVILQASDVSKLLTVAQLCTGLVLVNKDSSGRENRRNAKLDMIHILMNGHGVWYFPEGTWNLSPNKLHLPMSIGFLEVAQKAGVPVIPVAVEFTYDTTREKETITRLHIRYGAPIPVDIHDDLPQKLSEYEEAISTMRWELMAEKGEFPRREVTEQDYVNYLKGNYRNLVFGGKNLQLERSRIRGADGDFYRFYHINDVPFDENGALLETEEVLRLTDILRKNRIFPR